MSNMSLGIGQPHSVNLSILSIAVAAVIKLRSSGAVLNGGGL